MKPAIHVFWESVLIISSVFVFRSLWMLMDGAAFFSKLWVLAVLFVLGMVFAMLSLYKLTHAD